MHPSLLLFIIPPSRNEHFKDFLRGISFFHAKGLSRHNLRHPRLSRCESWRKKKNKSEREREVTASGTSIAANFFSKASHEKRLYRIYLIPQRNGAITARRNYWIFELGCQNEQRCGTEMERLV